MDAQSTQFITSLFIIIAVVVLVPLLLAWLYVVRVNRKGEWVKQNGRSVPAKIIKVIPNGRGIGSGDKKIQGVDFIFEVQPEDEQPYRLTHREQLRTVDIARITPGTTIELQLDPRNPQKVVLPSDWLTGDF